LHEWIALLAGPVGMAITLTGLLVLLAFGIRLFPGFVAELTWLLELTDRIRWHIPPWRRLQRADQQGRLIRHIRTGIKAGFDLDRILEAAGQLRLNRAYAPRVSRWRSGIARGDDPYEAAIKAGVGRRVAQVFRNQAGSRRLCQIMDAVCEQIQADVEHRLHMIQSIAFPAVVIVVAIPVAMLALWLVAMTTILVQLSM
jgi:type II secretory pathway component PulF